MCVRSPTSICFEIEKLSVLTVIRNGFSVNKLWKILLSLNLWLWSLRGYTDTHFTIHFKHICPKCPAESSRIPKYATQNVCWIEMFSYFTLLLSYYIQLYINKQHDNHKYSQKKKTKKKIGTYWALHTLNTQRIARFSCF